MEIEPAKQSSDQTICSILRLIMLCYVRIVIICNNYDVIDIFLYIYILYSVIVVQRLKIFNSVKYLR